QRRRDRRVVDGHLAKRDVGDRQIEAVGRQVDALEADTAVQPDVGVDVAKDTGGDRVELDGGDLGPGPQLRGHRRDEVAHAGGRLDDLRALQRCETELLDRLPDCCDDIEWRVEGSQRGNAEV